MTTDHTAEHSWRLFQERFGALHRARRTETQLTVAIIVLLFIVSAVWTDFSLAKIIEGAPKIGEYFDKAFGMPYVLRGGLTTESIGAPAPGSSSNNTEGQANSPGGTNSMGNNANRNQDSGNTSYQLVGRGVLLPYKDEDGNLLHTGVWGSYRSINNNYNQNGTVRSGGWQFVSQPDTSVDRTNWINTGNLTNVTCSNGAPLPVTSTGLCATVNGKKGHVVTAHQVNDVNMFGAELLGAYGPFHWSSEYMMAQINGVGYDSNEIV